MEREAALRQLDAVANELDRLGKAGLAERTRDAASALRADRYPHGEADVVSSSEAAALLGITNVGMIDRWAREGLLEECRVGGPLRVSRRSVERLAESPVAAGQRAWEREVDEVLTVFDFGDVELPPSEASSRGRVPWDDVVARTS